jgi:hypothetical protein
MKDDLNRLKSMRNLPDETAQEEDSVEGVFGFLRGVKERATMLELRLKTGDSVALSYSWLDKASYNPSTGITLQFSGITVQIEGRLLNNKRQGNQSLYEGLIRQRISWIEEADQAQTLICQDRTVVVSIRLK